VENRVDHLSRLSRPALCVADAGGSAAARQQLVACGGAASPPTASLTHYACSPGAMSPEDSGFNSDPLGEMVRMFCCCCCNTLT